jgi:hypothetical protein
VRVGSRERLDRLEGGMNLAEPDALYSLVKRAIQRTAASSNGGWRVSSIKHRHLHAVGQGDNTRKVARRRPDGGHVAAGRWRCPGGHGRQGTAAD